METNPEATKATTEPVIKWQGLMPVVMAEPVIKWDGTRFVVALEPSPDTTERNAALGEW